MPSNTVVAVYNDLIGTTHKVTRGSIGIQFREGLSGAVNRVYGFKNGVPCRRFSQAVPRIRRASKRATLLQQWMDVDQGRRRPGERNCKPQAGIDYPAGLRSRGQTYGYDGDDRRS